MRSLIVDLGDAYCEELRRTAIGDFDVADADPERIVPLSDALGFLPEARSTAGGAPGRARVAVPGQATGTVRLTDGEGRSRWLSAPARTCSSRSSVRVDVWTG